MGKVQCDHEECEPLIDRYRESGLMRVGIQVFEVRSDKYLALGIKRRTTMTEVNIEGGAVVRRLVDHVALKTWEQDS